MKIRLLSRSGVRGFCGLIAMPHARVKGITLHPGDSLENQFKVTMYLYRREEGIAHPSMRQEPARPELTLPISTLVGRSLSMLRSSMLALEVLFAIVTSSFRELFAFRWL